MIKLTLFISVLNVASLIGRSIWLGLDSLFFNDLCLSRLFVSHLWLSYLLFRYIFLR